jgi:hypothetical protein
VSFFKSLAKSVRTVVCSGVTPELTPGFDDDDNNNNKVNSSNKFIPSAFVTKSGETADFSFAMSFRLCRLLKLSDPEWGGVKVIKKFVYGGLQLAGAPYPMGLCLRSCDRNHESGSLSVRIST